MDNKTQTKKTNKRVIIIAALVSVLIIVALALYLFVPKTNPKKYEVTSQNKDNAAALRVEKNQAPVIIDNKTVIDPQNQEQSSAEDVTSESPTVDQSGMSTNLNRAGVRPAVAAVLAIYQDFLSKVQAVPMNQRQAIADQYLADNRAMFGSDYGYLNSDTLHLFPQSAEVNLPSSVSINSAIVDPDDSTQTIVQVYMQPDNTWSLLAYVKMNVDGSLGTFEKLIVRNNQNPL